MSSLFNSGAPGGHGDLIKDGSDQAFMADVVEASKAQPVLVDFWAPWCGPCRTLTPALEAQVRAAHGKIRLVKINIDENPGVAGQLGVRSIPAVFAFDQGRPVDGFMGALPESQVKQFIDRVLGGGGAGGEDELSALLDAADQSLTLHDIGGAAQAYAAVLQADPENVKALAGLARCYLLGGDLEKAKAVIEMVPAEKQSDAGVQGVLAALQLADVAPQGADAQRLMAQVSANPSDHAARFDLAGALAGRGDLAGAVDHLLTLIEADREWNEGAARAQLLKVFEAAGPLAEVTKSGRRRLSAILFS